MLFKKNHIRISAPKFLILIIFLFPDSFAIAQSKTNLEILFSLVDSSIVEINSSVPLSVKEIKIDFNHGNYFSVFQNQVIYDFVKLGRTVIPDLPARLVSDTSERAGQVGSVNNTGAAEVNYTLENAGVEYGEMERDGFLGSFLMPRKLKIDGSYSVKNNTVQPGNFHYTYQDTIAVDDIKTLENPSFPFTQGEVPSEPFLSGLFEPVVAIGSAALAVILFFTVRSK